jgi:signal transduction histidine kinase/ActR/RegA family two-component response regulator
MPSPLTDSAQSQSAATRFKRLRARVVVFGVLVLLAFAGASIYDVWHSHRHTVTATEREISNVANALAEQTAWSWQAVDLVLRDTARWYKEEVKEIPEDKLDSVLSARTAGARQVKLFTIIDTHGIQRHRSKGSSPPGIDDSDRSYFIALRDHPNSGLYISEPLVTRSTGRSAIILARRLEDDRGQFAGVVTAIVDLADLQRFYSAVNLGMGTATYLVRDDGTLFLRNPPAPTEVGQRFPTLAAASVSRARVFANPIDGNPNFIASADVRDTPLKLAVTRDQQTALRPWRDESISIAARTVVLTLLGGLTIVAVLRQLRHIEAGERALRESEAQLRQAQKMEAIGTLAGGIAHDFNNILGAILGYGELALQRATEGTAQRRYLDNVMHAAGRAKALVDRILGFSRSGMGERIPVNVRFVIEETLELLQASLPGGIRIEKRLEAGDAAVIGDATHLHQVAMNLCTNAMQAMASRGGVISVALERVELTEARSVARGTLAPGRYLRLVISDTGDGIPPEVFERIFDPFFTTKGVGEGTGLGLSLVHGIVTDLGGGIDVQSKVGEGTCFEIWLPAAGETRKPVAEKPYESPLGGGQTILVVDDELALVSLSEEMLAQLGYEPVGFDSSAAALRAFEAQPLRFDVILTDEAMPELTGTDLARAIRRLRPDVPIILMSGYGGPQLTARASSSGVNEVLRKPLQGKELAESLARVLEIVPEAS